MPQGKGIHCVCCEREQYSCRSRLALGHRERIAPLYDNVLSNVFRSPELSSLNSHSFGTGTLHEAYHRHQSSADQASLRASHKRIQLASSYFMEKCINGGNRKYLGLQRLQQLNLVSCAKDKEEPGGARIFDLPAPGSSYASPQSQLFSVCFLAEAVSNFTTCNCTRITSIPRQR